MNVNLSLFLYTRRNKQKFSKATKTFFNFKSWNFCGVKRLFRLLLIVSKLFLRYNAPFLLYEFHLEKLDSYELKTMNTIFIFVIWILWQKSVSKRYSFLRANKLFLQLLHNNSTYIVLFYEYNFMISSLWNSHKMLFVAICVLPSIQTNFAISFYNSSISKVT